MEPTKQQLENTKILHIHLWSIIANPMWSKTDKYYIKHYMKHYTIVDYVEAS